MRMGEEVSTTIYLLRVSHYDRKVHAYRQPLGRVLAEAVCSHSALTRELLADDGTRPVCGACALIVPAALADRLGGDDSDRWGQ